MSLARIRNATTDKPKLANMAVADVELKLDTLAAGLSKAQAQHRLKTYGYNELREDRVNPVLQFLSYLWGPIPWLSEAAAVLSAIVKHWVDPGIILALLIVNAVVGFWEEFQADNTSGLISITNDEGSLTG